MRGLAAAIVLASGALWGCATARPVAAPEPSVRAPSRAVSGDARALEQWVSRLRAATPEGLAAARAAGVRLEPGANARTLTGDAAEDDAVAVAETVLCREDGAVVLVRTRCGNAYLLGLAPEASGWSRRSLVALVEDASPGHLRRTRVAAESRAMLGPVAREVVAMWESVGEEGDELPAARLGVFSLGQDGALVARGDVEFGRVEEASGLVLEGTWEVDEALSLPRDLYVQLTPSRAGAAGREVLRRTYRVTEGRLRLVEEERAPLRPRGP